jgi:hypothetical protein
MICLPCFRAKEPCTHQAPTVADRVRAWRDSQSKVDTTLLNRLIVKAEEDNLQERKEIQKHRRKVASVNEALGAANRSKSKCPYGHPYDENNTYFYFIQRTGRYTRKCRKCALKRAVAWNIANCGRLQNR